MTTSWWVECVVLMTVDCASRSERSLGEQVENVWRSADAASIRR
jgi:hypothetical protein